MILKIFFYYFRTDENYSYYIVYTNNLNSSCYLLLFFNFLIFMKKKLIVRIWKQIHPYLCKYTRVIPKNKHKHTTLIFSAEKYLQHLKQIEKIQSMKKLNNK